MREAEVIQEEGENLAYFLANQRRWRRKFPGKFALVDAQRLVAVADTFAAAGASRVTPAGIIVRLKPFPRPAPRRSRRAKLLRYV